jgi:hypothetical protein
MKRKLPTDPLSPRRFVRSSTRTTNLLCKHDVVLIDVPEDFEIHMTIPACAHGHVGNIISEITESLEEVEVLLWQSIDTEEEEYDLFVPRKRRSRQEIIKVPKFCLCLEEQTLVKRLNKRIEL